LNTVVEYGEAFYGPKLDFMVKDALETMAMERFRWINLPERFDLTYKGSDNELHRPVMIPFWLNGTIYCNFMNIPQEISLFGYPEQAIILSW
jgi:threonyl-tRNA synthetase